MRPCLLNQRRARGGLFIVLNWTYTNLVQPIDKLWENLYYTIQLHENCTKLKLSIPIF